MVPDDYLEQDIEKAIQGFDLCWAGDRHGMQNQNPGWPFQCPVQGNHQGPSRVLESCPKVIVLLQHE
jgi:hypothetical protein